MKLSEFNKSMAAVAFAEAGEHQAAREMMPGTKKSQSGKTGEPAKKPYLHAVVFGSISIVAYLLLLKNESLVTETFTQGGWFTALPVGAAFLFSFIHGAFASNLLALLGLEAKK